MRTSTRSPRTGCCRSAWRSGACCWHPATRAAVERLAGLAAPSLPLTWATLTEPFRHKPGLTRFLPATLSPDGYHITPIRWQGSSDVPSLARANAYLVADEDRESWEAGQQIGVLAQ